MNPPDSHHPTDPALLASRLARERLARMEAEDLLESKSRELHISNEKLAHLNTELEARVVERTCELEAAKATAEEASAAKSAFFAGISHEIRTPLNGVIGATALLADLLQNPAEKSLLATVSASAELLLALVNDVLDFSKIEAGRLELDAAPFDLTELLARCKNLFETSAQGKGVDLILECNLPSPCHVLGDSLRLQQVLVNLLGNAIKFTPAGSVILRVTPLPPEAGTPPRYHFAVTDTGPGLTAEQQARLFQPFVQAGNSPRDRAGGSGLGLITCERLVALAGGQLRLASRIGRGTTLEFSLPLAPAAAASPLETSLQIANQGASLRIAIADDVKINVDILTLILRRMGHQVSAFLSGTDLIAHLAHEPADLAIIDLQMPGLDGIATARHLRNAMQSGTRMPLIAFTADARVETVRHCLDQGFDACIHKPIRPTLLAATINRLVAPR